MANGTLAASQIEMLSQSGTGIITITPPATNTNRAITLPDAAGAIVVSGTTPSLNGITFPATQVASAGANTLDDYEEGTWTPVFAGSGSNPTVTYSQQAGSYTKIGNRVFYEALVIISSVSAQGTGNILINGLPFAAAGGNYEFVGRIGYNDVFDTAFPAVYVNSTQFVIIPTGVTQSNANYGSASATASNLSSGYFAVSGHYFAS